MTHLIGYFVTVLLMMVHTNGQQVDGVYEGSGEINSDNKTEDDSRFNSQHDEDSASFEGKNVNKTHGSYMDSANKNTSNIGYHVNKTEYSSHLDGTGNSKNAINIGETNSKNERESESRSHSHDDDDDDSYEGGTNSEYETEGDSRSHSHDDDTSYEGYHVNKTEHGSHLDGTYNSKNASYIGETNSKNESESRSHSHDDDDDDTYEETKSEYGTENDSRLYSQHDGDNATYQETNGTGDSRSYSQDDGDYVTYEEKHVNKTRHDSDMNLAGNLENASDIDEIDSMEGAPDDSDISYEVEGALNMNTVNSDTEITLISVSSDGERVLSRNGHLKSLLTLVILVVQYQ